MVTCGPVLGRYGYGYGSWEKTRDNHYTITSQLYWLRTEAGAVKFVVIRQVKLVSGRMVHGAEVVSQGRIRLCNVAALVLFA
jgi:hypothetical protein